MGLGDSVPFQARLIIDNRPEFDPTIESVTVFCFAVPGSKGDAEEWADRHLHDTGVEQLLEDFKITEHGVFCVLLRGVMRSYCRQSCDGEDWDEDYAAVELQVERLPDDYFKYDLRLDPEQVAEAAAKLCQGCFEAVPTDELVDGLCRACRV